ncbi:uncharacterized protein UTRI_05896 [Ustilago trichophora]|uniref:Uncharacterized protein n=1 Tax=Ustilago trichophora TaxID=86804 RepID=A0A5C3EK05_9BASI|nr:uncharacterized protein UTRI_05896 [Ustilago trichophora]
MLEPKTAPTPAIIVKIYQPLEVCITEFIARGREKVLASGKPQSISKFHQDGLGQILDLLASKGVSEIDVWMPRKLIWDTRAGWRSRAGSKLLPPPPFSVEEETCLIHVSPDISHALAKHVGGLSMG